MYIETRDVSKVGRLTEMTQHLVNRWRWMGRGVGDGKVIPLRYCESEVNGIYSEPHDNGDSDHIITI